MPDIANRLIELRDRANDTNDSERRTEQVLRCTLTQDEIVACAREAADAQREAKRLEQDLAHFKKTMQGRIEGQEAIVDANSEKVRNGYDLRSVECVDILDHPKRGRKTTFRLDTLEAVSETLMTDSERQRMLTFEETQTEKF